MVNLATKPNHPLLILAYPASEAVTWLIVRENAFRLVPTILWAWLLVPLAMLQGADLSTVPGHEEITLIKPAISTETGLLRDALGQHIPRGDADAGLNHQCDRYPVGEEADQKLNDATGEDEGRRHEYIQLHNWPVDIGPIWLKWPYDEPVGAIAEPTAGRLACP